jgi:hypothetical protein
MRLPSGRGSRGGRHRREDDAYPARDTDGRGRTHLVGGGDQPEYRPDRGARAHEERGARPQYPPRTGLVGGPGPGPGAPGYGPPGYGTGGYGTGGYGTAGDASYGDGRYGDGGNRGPGYGAQPGYGGPGNNGGAGYQGPGYGGPGYEGGGFEGPGYGDPGYGAQPGYEGPGNSGGPGYQGPGYSRPGYGAQTGYGDGGYGGPGYADGLDGGPGYERGGYRGDGNGNYGNGNYGHRGAGYQAGGHGGSGYRRGAYGDGRSGGGYYDDRDAGGVPYAFNEDSPERPGGPDYPRREPVRRRRYRRGQGAVRRLPAIAIPTPVLAAVAFVACVVLVVAGVGLSRMTVNRTSRPMVAAAFNPNCTLIVPDNPLSPLGLATPYLLRATDPAAGACHEANPNQTAFVQAAIIDTKTGQISIYDPLVIDGGTTPVAAPVVPQLTPDSVVALWFGYNGNDLTLAGADQMQAVSPSQPLSMDLSASESSAGGFEFPASAPTSDFLLQQADCVSGEDINGKFSTFTQVAACNATAFFTAAEAAIGAGKLKVPSPGTAADGQDCLTTRSFALVDQDQSGSVSTEYLAEPGGQTAQDTAANTQALTGASVLSNGSDSGLLDQFVDPALQCSPWEVPNQTDGGALSPALPLDELQAAVWAGKQGSGPVALVPLNDPMTLDQNANFNVDKTDAYRSNVDMSPLPAGESPSQYCADLEQIQGSRLQEDVNLLIKAPSPAPGVADNLFTFMALRLRNSFVSLDCGAFGQANDVSTTVNGAGVVVAACFARQVPQFTPGRGNPMAGRKTCPATTG